MKILQINVVYNSGSTGRIVANISDTSQKHGIESFVAFGRGNTSNLPLAVKKFGNHFELLLHILKTRLFDMHGFGSSLTTRKLLLYISTLRPDIIHLHNVHGYYLNINILFNYFKENKTPIVWTMHDCWPLTGHCVHFERIDCQKWKSGCFKCPITKSYPKSWYWDNSKINFRKKKGLFSYLPNLTLVPVSDWLNSVVSESFLKSNDSKVIHNGVDLNIFRVIPSVNTYWFKYLNIPIKSKIILAVTNVWTVEKGFNDVLSLYKLLPKDYVIVIVGVTNLQKKELPMGLHGIRRTENTLKLVELYNIASVYINPTYEDNFPTTNIEALACGTPVVTYNTGGSPEAIDDETGYVVKKGDINELVSVVKEVCKQGKDYYKTKCRIRAEKFFNKEDRYNDYIELYKEILNKSDVTIQK